MKIKHLESGNIISLNYKEWCDNYIKKGIYKKFEITDYNGIVELQVSRENGEITKQPFDSSSALNNKNQFPNKMFIEKKLSFETYNKWLVPKNQSRLFSFLKIFKYQKPIAKLTKEGKRHITLVIIMILGILVTVYIAYKQGAFN